ncbi:2TM domain-containing protein [Flavobacterium sp. DG1-102-2]|uniref:2TM domain-containing protein n=1 Tax=Flavobacterium sp. DG1-102-2 TaxID=3081663 RepID=UPI0029492ACB|nr:2TM domain-containing protein [Flavobacterium sp. DG1-102-2]MDV6168058.1 2TM domain-containing protein [Flavobacterium sp. DG1-102-2]
MEKSFDEQVRLQKARKKVKEIKGFYMHFVIYLIVNIFFLIVHAFDLKEGENFFEWDTFMMPLGWGIGVFFHWLGAFKPSVTIAKEWEKRKIQELMEQEKNNKKEWQ